MPRLPEYDAPSRELAPSDKGANAFEQAGRRIGPAYNEAATLTREQGAVASDLIKQRRWPFDAQELYHSLDLIERAKAKTAEGGGVGFKVEGGTGGRGGSDSGILSDSGGSDRSGGKGHKSKSGADVGGMSIAAAGLGRLAGAMAKGNQYRNSVIDPVSGLDLSLPQNQPKGYTALEHGRLVHYGPAGQRLSPTPKDQFSGPNADAERAAQGDATGQWSPALDWTNPQNNSKRLKEYQRTGVDPVTGQMQPPPGPNGQPALPSSYNNGGIDGANSYGNPILPQDRDYGGGSDASAYEQSYRDNTSVTNQVENPFDRLSYQGADEARGAISDMRNQFGDRSGAGSDAMSGNTDDTMYGGGSDEGAP
jgi:hypothetical protein